MNAAAPTAESSPLIAALRDPARYAHPVVRIDVLETHISWVILTGQYAYKIKKPVNLGFLDFSTLEARRSCCEEELRLNRRLTPSLYIAVVKITGSAGSPHVGSGDADIAGDATALEYAVKMREFAQSTLAGSLLAQGVLTGTHFDTLAARIAAFHAGTGIAARGCPYGTPEMVITSARDNFAALDDLLPDPADQARIAPLRDWTEHEYHTRQTLFSERQVEGYIRECHGDLHLGNIVMLEGTLTPFDGIEFNPALRWIDVMSEVAFLVMDLMDRGRADFATGFLNAYLEAGGDYAGLDVLRFYLVYRALVRAKVHALRAAQDGIAAAGRARLINASRHYIELAQRCTSGTHNTHNAPGAIILMHGVSGSGKSVIAQALAAHTGAIRLRSDVERKRLNGFAPLARSGSTPGCGIYAGDLTLATYNRLLDLARRIAHAGYTVIVDATFLKFWQRDLFRRQAQNRGVPFAIVDVTAPEAMLRTRIAARLDAGADASEADQAVLTHQIAQREALTGDESSAALNIDTTRADVTAIVHEAVAALVERGITPDQGALGHAGNAMGNGACFRTAKIV